MERHRECLVSAHTQYRVSVVIFDSLTRVPQGSLLVLGPKIAHLQAHNVLCHELVDLLFWLNVHPDVVK